MKGKVKELNELIDRFNSIENRQEKKEILEDIVYLAEDMPVKVYSHYKAYQLAFNSKE